MGSTLAAAIERARALHAGQQLEAAASAYRQIIAAHPDAAEAHYRYANLLKDQGALEQALQYYDRATALQSNYAHAYCNRAVVLGFLQRLPEALASYDHAIAIDPRDAIAQCNRAMVLLSLGRKDAALAGFETAAGLDPNSFPAHVGRAGLLQERGQWLASLAAYDRAIAIHAGDAATHLNRGTVLKELSRHGPALASLDRAIALNPQFARAHVKRAEVLQALDRSTEALESYDRALELDASDVGAHGNRAVLLQSMGRLSAALAGYDQAVALNCAHAQSWFNRGTALRALGDPDAALASYERAIVENPRLENAYVNRGVILGDLGRHSEAMASCRQAIALNPRLAEAHYNLALIALKGGEYTVGWQEYEWRWHAKEGPIFREKRDFREPLWLGDSPIAGKTILLYGEQGLGDSLQFCRYVELVARLGPRLLLEVPGPLVGVCSTLAGVAEVIPHGSPLPRFDLQCPLMSLPLAFQTTVESIPAAAGYLRTDAGRVARWQATLGEKHKLRIGLTWSGNQTAGTNRKRHFPLADLVPYLSEAHDYFCLQTDITAADQATLHSTPRIRQFTGALRDFTDTAALCACMDLVISIDTSVAHLSGALGRPTWALLAFNADWRWLIQREDCPWYSSVRLFRQQSPGDWQGVFERVRTHLDTAFERL